MGCFARVVQMPIIALLKPGDTFLDVGANIGFMTLLAASRVGEKGRVIAVEPYPPTFDALEQNVRFNSLAYVQLHQFALSSEAGFVRLWIPAPDDHREFNVSILQNDGTTPIDVPAQTLDESVAKWGATSIQLMKIDVEGAEPHVFKGGAHILESGVVRHLVCEINGKYLVRQGSSPMDLLKQIESLGFVFGKLDGGLVVPAPRPALTAADEIDGLFVHRSVLTQANRC
jgi:FkbM family methyltransferase